jgi:hypothetical protein
MIEFAQLVSVERDSGSAPANPETTELNLQGKRAPERSPDPVHRNQKPATSPLVLLLLRPSSAKWRRRDKRSTLPSKD